MESTYETAGLALSKGNKIRLMAPLKLIKHHLKLCRGDSGHYMI